MVLWPPMVRHSNEIHGAEAAHGVHRQSQDPQCTGSIKAQAVSIMAHDAKAAYNAHPVMGPLVYRQIKAQAVSVKEYHGAVAAHGAQLVMRPMVQRRAMVYIGSHKALGVLKHGPGCRANQEYRGALTPRLTASEPLLWADTSESESLLRPGKQLYNKGYRAKHPVIIIPGVFLVSKQATKARPSFRVMSVCYPIHESCSLQPLGSLKAAFWYVVNLCNNSCQTGFGNSKPPNCLVSKKDSVTMNPIWGRHSYLPYIFPNSDKLDTLFSCPISFQSKSYFLYDGKLLSLLMVAVQESLHIQAHARTSTQHARTHTYAHVQGL
eukprot:1147280-Pelagomonas_calceolata.AAC.5